MVQTTAAAAVILFCLIAFNTVHFFPTLKEQLPVSQHDDQSPYQVKLPDGYSYISKEQLHRFFSDAGVNGQHTYVLFLVGDFLFAPALAVLLSSVIDFLASFQCDSTLLEFLKGCKWLPYLLCVDFLENMFTLVALHSHPSYSHDLVYFLRNIASTVKHFTLKTTLCIIGVLLLLRGHHHLTKGHPKQQ